MIQTLPETKHQPTNLKLLLNIGFGLFGLLALFVILFAVVQPIKVLPRIRLAPGFSLLDADQKRLTSEDLRGQIVLYSFTYIRCPEPCGDMSATMQEVQQRVDALYASGIPFTMVTISFDPEHDTPDRLSAFAAARGADPDRWHFATTTDATALKQLIGGGFEVYYSPNDAGSFDFDPAYVLVDGWGIIRGQYQYQTLASDADRIVRHVSVLFDEIENSQGAARLAYEAAHLFLCYAR